RLSGQRPPPAGPAFRSAGAGAARRARGAGAPRGLDRPSLDLPAMGRVNLRPMRDSFSRRRFVVGLSAGGVLASAGPLWLPRSVLARTGPADALTGTELDLTIARHPVSFTGRVGDAVLVNGSLPAPLLRWREGDTVTIRVHNRLDEDTSIHWHGIVLPASMDGVPGVS